MSGLSYYTSRDPTKCIHFVVINFAESTVNDKSYIIFIFQTVFTVNESTLCLLKYYANINIQVLRRKQWLTLSGLAFENYVKAWGGADSAPPWKTPLESLSPILFYTVTYTHIDSPNLEGQVSSFKLLELGAAQSSKAARRKFGNQKFAKVILADSFFWGQPKINRGT
jgi:hypothetical protein